MGTVTDLKKEIDRLTFDLQQACQEKIQAAEYGLAVLEEKQKIQDKYEELENTYNSRNKELERAKEQIKLLKTKSDVLAHKVDQQHGNIVQESTTRESAFATKISDLHLEIKQLKKSEKGFKQECEITKQNFLELQKNHEVLVNKKDQTMHENRILKSKEARFNEEYNTLEEENTSLQKSLSRAKQTLVEFEGLKVENQSLLDEIDSLRLQLQMATSARDQFEKQLHESLESLKEQREKLTHNQKEINELKQQAIAQKCDLLYGKGSDFNGSVEIGEGGEHPLVRQIEQEYKTSHPSPSSAVVDDILKELQGGEVRDLEEQLRTVREEKDHLQKELTRQTSSADLAATADSSSPTRSSSGEGVISLNNQLKELKDSRSRESAYQLEIKRLTVEIDELKELLLDLENEKNSSEKTSKEECKQLSDEILQVKSKLRESDGKLKELGGKLNSVRETSSETEGLLKSTQDGVLELLYQFRDVQTKMAAVNGEELGEHNKVPILPKSNDVISPSHCLKMVNQLKGQTQSLNVAIEKALHKQKSSSSNKKEETGQDHDIIAENAQFKEQILKLKSLVTTKREQISTLRTVLKANKSTYEVALANLKSRYENDKQIQSEANGQLKKQIRSLKSECQTFSSLRSMFASRCEEYVQEIQEKQKIIMAAEEEKRTLNQLLKQAIHQKVALTQRVEEFEIARERLRQFTKKNSKSTTGSASGPGDMPSRFNKVPQTGSRTQRQPSGPRGPPRPVTRL